MKPCASAASSRPASWSKSMQWGNRLSPITNRGKICFSAISTLKPSRCSMEAAAEPEGPAPMIKTSVSVGFIVLVWRQTLLLDLFGLQQRGHTRDLFIERPVLLQGWRNAADHIVKLLIIAAHHVFAPAHVRRLGQRDGFNGDEFPKQRQSSARHL